MSEDPQFQIVSAPDSFPRDTESGVRFVPVTRQGTLMGYVWASVTDDAAGYIARDAAGDDGFNTGVRWVQRLRWAKANGLTPLQVLTHWAGQPEDAATGRISPDAESTGASLAELRAHAGQ
jgi:hypothetical protein